MYEKVIVVVLVHTVQLNYDFRWVVKLEVFTST